MEASAKDHLLVHPPASCMGAGWIAKTARDCDAERSGRMRRSFWTISKTEAQA